MNFLRGVDVYIMTADTCRQGSDPSFQKKSGFCAKIVFNREARTLSCKFPVSTYPRMRLENQKRSPLSLQSVSNQCPISVQSSSNRGPISRTRTCNLYDVEICSKRAVFCFLGKCSTQLCDYTILMNLTKRTPFSAEMIMICGKDCKRTGCQRGESPLFTCRCSFVQGLLQSTAQAVKETFPLQFGNL